MSPWRGKIISVTRQPLTHGPERELGWRGEGCPQKSLDVALLVEVEWFKCTQPKRHELGIQWELNHNHQCKPACFLHQDGVQISPLVLISKASPLCTGAELNLRDRVLGEIEKNNIIALPGEGGHSWLPPLKTLCAHLEGFDEGLPGGWDDKEFACSVQDPSSIPGWGGSPGEGNGYPLQYSFLIPGTQEPGGLQSMGSQRALHDWVTDTFTKSIFIAIVQGWGCWQD